MKKDTLYTVNRFNKPAFMPKENQYNIGGVLSGLENKLGNVMGGGKLAGSLAGDLIGAAGTAVGGLANNLLSNGLNSGAGSAVSSLGSTVGGMVSKVNPVLGGIISVGSGLIGGGINALFGESVDEEALQAANEGTASYNNFVSNAGSFDEIKGPEAQANVKEVYKGGLFNDVSWKNEELKRQRADARSWAFRGVDNNIHNLVSDQLNNALANYSAYGGALELMQQNRYFDTIDKRSAAIASKNAGMPTAFTGAKTFDDGGYMTQEEAAKVVDNSWEANTLFNDAVPWTMKQDTIFGKEGFNAMYGNLLKGNSPALYSLGGDLQTHGSDWSTGLVTIGAEGSHEKNPYDGGQLTSEFLDSFSTDPIGAAVRYNQGIEALAAQEEARQAEAAREAEYADMQKRLLSLETQNQGLQALMAAMPTYNEGMTGTTANGEPSGTTSVSKDYSNLKGSLKMSEGFTSKAHTLGSEKYPTIGYGFYNIYPGTKRRVKAGDTITEEEADRYLDVAIQERERELAPKVPNWHKLSQNQKDALIDLAFNAGSAAPHFRRDSKLMRALANEDWEEASKHLATTSRNPNFARGMRNRSNRRRNMFVNGDYGLKAFGGELGTNGTDFTNGLLYIDEGGSHESNPLDGVPMGLDPEGIPNLVEEGETVYNDYVFSDRLKVPFFMYKELGLGGVMKKKGKQMSFADASKKLAQESEQRPNDPISQDGLKASLAKLAEVQEAERMRKQAEEYNNTNEFACGGMKNKYKKGGNKLTNLNTYAYDPIETFKYWNKDNNDYDEGYRDFIKNKLNDAWINRVMQGSEGDMSRYKGSNNVNPTVDQAIMLGLDKKNSDWHKAMAKAYDDYLAGIDPKTGLKISATPAPVSPVASKASVETEPQPEQGMLLFDPKIMGNTEAMRTGTRETTVDENGTKVTRVSGENTGEDNPPTYPTWMRYAPVVGAGIMSLTDALGLTNKPDYTYAAGLEAAARQAGYAPKVSYNPIGDYMRYSPLDRQYYINQLQANARATDRALTNTTSPSKAAELLANGYNTTLSLGNLARQAEEYNRAQYERVKDFNRKTNMFNSQMGLEAAMANARYAQQAKEAGLSGLARAAALRDSIDARTGAAKSANLTNFLTSLGNIGRENFAMNQINWDRSRRHATRANGTSYDKVAEKNKRNRSKSSNG